MSHLFSPPADSEKQFFDAGPARTTSPELGHRMRRRLRWQRQQRRFRGQLRQDESAVALVLAAVAAGVATDAAVVAVSIGRGRSGGRISRNAGVQSGAATTFYATTVASTSGKWLVNKISHLIFLDRARTRDEPENRVAIYNVENLKQTMDLLSEKDLMLDFDCV